MLIHKTKTGWELEANGVRSQLPANVAAHEDLHAYLQQSAGSAPTVITTSEPVAPIDSQEVWAAGVTYFRSRTARMAESETAGGGSFYDRVYNAERPELFFKALPYRVVGPGGAVRIRRDSKWNVPEPELALLISPGGKIQGYTIGNDMSSRDIEGENPLYLPQAKSYDGSCALGPAIVVTPEPLSPSTEIRMKILRRNESVFADSTTLAAMKRQPVELVEYLFRETSFPNGCFLLTGTGIIPPDTFTLHSGDAIEIAIDGIGLLRNTVA
jgi:2-dehydro-3-deoxy-D-arabinonate dehydratase